MRKKINKPNIQTSIACLILIYYLILYPINLLLGKLINIPVIGASKTTLMLIIIYCAFNVFNRNIKINKRNILLLISLIIMIVTIVTFPKTQTFSGLFVGDKYYTLKNYCTYFLTSTIIPSIALVIVGMEFKRIIINIKKYKRVTLNLFMILTGLVIIVKFSHYNVSGMGILKDTGGYLFISDAYAIISIIGIYISKHKKTLGLVSIFALYLIGSRSALLIFIVTLFIFYVIKYKSWNLRVMILSFLAIASLGGFLYITNSDLQNSEYIKSNRVLNVIVNPSADASNIERKQISEMGKNVIKEHPINGKFFYEITDNDMLGKYIHNILSYWAEYGIFVFIIILGLSMKNILTIINLNNINIVMCVFIFIFLSAFLTRSYYTVFLWMALAVNTESIKSINSSKEQLTYIVQ